MEYLAIQDFSDKWDISKRRIQLLCREGRINGAKMIGNMWVIPENAERPSDARIKNPVAKAHSSISNVRKDLKKLLKLLYKRCQEIGIDEVGQRAYVLTAIASGLCSFYLGESTVDNNIYRMIYNDISGAELLSKIDVKVMDLITDFIRSYRDDSDLDSVLAWAYQYSNKLVNGNIFSQTQFFTEKYMITYLVDNIPNLFFASKILDPCTGGGNFLVECLERLCKEITDNDILETVILNVKKLYGFDIDSNITGIAVVNIRLKAFSILKRNNIDFKLDAWDAIRPNIYKSKEIDYIEGSLAIDNKCLINAITGEAKTASAVLGAADVILTNPPFATIKGMAQEQKKFLKTYYPDARCDTCVSFLERIHKMLNADGYCGIVSQNAWLHLKTFNAARARFTSQYEICKIINLGSGAFQDLSGEKSNVSLIVFGNTYKENNEIDVLNLSSYSLGDKIEALKNNIRYMKKMQDEIDGPNGYDFTEKNALKTISESKELYRDIAVPMQGTSTGNAKELVGYFWEHFGDDEWSIVSNGGGYCRWQGLNNRIVKWGKNGEYIKSQKGSALRNVRYFPKTQMVFSDTGTAGLNVRVLLNKQIFIASGPGIRITKGNKYAHLALLNSRLASYYVRAISPKLTIAAGYIGQIPVKEAVYSSVVLERNAKLCVELKKKMLSIRPNNLEYDGTYLENIPKNLNQAAWILFNEDITNEALKLEIESKIDQYIFHEYGFSTEDAKQFDQSVGECAYLIDGIDDIDLPKLDKYISKLIDAACCLKRTRASKNILGCDGLVEYVAKDLNINPEIIVRKIQENPFKMEKVLDKYKGMLLHNAILYSMGYNTKNGIKLDRISLCDIIRFLFKRFGGMFEYEDWLTSSFNIVHNEIFKGAPFLVFENKELHRCDNSIKG